LPASCRPAIFAARHLYREIGQEVARRGHDSVSTRARVSGIRKIWLVGRALASAMPRGEPQSDLPPLRETAYLVQAAVQPAGFPVEDLGRLAGRILWVAELFATLNARQRPSRGQA
jgi:phytoene synthase